METSIHAITTQRELAQIQGALQKKLGFFVTKLLSCNYSSDSARYFIPFYARNILEISATALLARIDPFRAIITYKFKMTLAIL